MVELKSFNVIYKFHSAKLILFKFLIILQFKVFSTLDVCLQVYMTSVEVGSLNLNDSIVEQAEKITLLAIVPWKFRALYFSVMQ